MEGGLHPARKYQPSAGAVKGSKILWPRPSAPILNLARAEPLHGQSILKVLRTKPLTAPAPALARTLNSAAQIAARALADIAGASAGGNPSGGN